MKNWVNDYIDFYKKIWLISPSDSNIVECDWWGNRILPQRKLLNYYRLKKMIRNLEKILALYKGDVNDEFSENWIDFINRNGKVTKLIPKNIQHMAKEDGFRKVTTEFYNRATSEFPSMPMVDIFQALRNVWIMNTIQMLEDKPVMFTDSIYAYSMLYPLTDNILDDVNISRESKIEFNKRLRRRLEGELIKSVNSYEVDVYRMITLIENEFDRKKYPQVYESLLQIQKGQELSLTQQSGKTDVLYVSLYKGGTSVLADALLVLGEIDFEKGRFMFGFGAFLQFADDLQDISVDFKSGHNTIFTKEKRCEELFWKFFSFVSIVIDKDERYLSNSASEIKDLMRTCMVILTLSTISDNSEFYGRKFLCFLSKYMSIPKNSYNKIKKEILILINNTNDRMSSESFDALVTWILNEGWEINENI